MSYVGNTNTTQAFTPAVDYFSGNGSTIAFTLSRPVASTAQVQAVVNNVPQNPTDAFTVLNNTITFTSAPSSGTNNIYVQYTSPITQVIQPGQGTVGAVQLAAGAVGTAGIADGAVTTAKIAAGAVATVDIADGAVTAAKFAANAISTNTYTSAAGVEKFFYGNAAPNNQPIYTSFTLSAAEAPIGSYVVLTSWMTSGNSAGQQYCYVAQKTLAGGTPGMYNYIYGWYWNTKQTSLFYISDASDRTFQIAHGTIAYTNNFDGRYVFYNGYIKVTQ